MGKHFSWDYEEPGGMGFYHIYDSSDEAPVGMFDGTSVMQFFAPESTEMNAVCAAIVDALDKAVEIADGWPASVLDEIARAAQPSVSIE